MIAEIKDDSQFTLMQPAQSTAELVNEVGDNRPTQIRIRIRVSQKYYHEPVISHLISEYSLNVNVNAALLAANAPNDGWFDLELRGTNKQIQRALIYLNQLDVKIWSQSTDPEEENW